MLRNGLIWVLVLALGWMGVAGACCAQDATKPLAVVSYAGYDRTMKAIELFGQLAGKPDQAAGIDAMIKMMTGGQGLQGLDPKRPLGVVVRGEGADINGYAFLPVTDLKQLLTVATPFVGPVTETAGLYKIERGEQTIYVKKKGDWAFVGGKPEHLDKLPDDPGKLLGDLPEQYLWALRISVGNLPPEVRDLLISRLQMIVQSLGQQLEGAQQEIVRERMQELMAQMEKGLKELDQITIGLQIDRQARQGHLDIQVTARPGTPSAERIASAAQAKTNFAGLLDPQATIAANWTATRMVQNAEQIDKQIAAARQQAVKQLESSGLSDEDQKVARQILDDLLDIARQTVKTGRVDGGVKAILDEKTATLVAGSFVLGGAKLDDVLKRLSELATKAVPEAPSYFKLNAGSYKGLRLHTATIPLPSDMENRDQVAKLVGENLEVVVGVGDEAFYVALGRGAIVALKQAVDQSQADQGHAVQPFQVSVALVPLSRFIAAVGDANARQTFERISKQISGLAGKDAVRLTVSPIERGMQVRLLLEEGVLKAAATAAPGGVPGANPAP